MLSIKLTFFKHKFQELVRQIKLKKDELDK
jgi:hypothetical protein